MSGSGPQFTFVRRHIRGLRGGSQPILAEASDGNVYVVKFLDNLQGPHVLFNESMGTELYRACGLHTSPWEVLRVTNSFIDRNPSCWLETPAGMRRPAAGLCFGSRYLGGNGGELFEVLPGGYFHRVMNGADFWLAWVVDVCANHTDIRQAIFCEEPSRYLEAVFIDFGHMFGGPKGDANPHFRASRYRDERVYPRPNAQFLLTLRKILANLRLDQLLHQHSNLPEEWKSCSAEQALFASLNRLSNSRFVKRTLETLVDSMGPWTRAPACPRYAASSRVSNLPPLLRTKTKERIAVA